MKLKLRSSQLLCFLRNNNAIVKKHTSPEYCSKQAFVSPYSISPNESTYTLYLSKIKATIMNTYF